MAPGAYDRSDRSDRATVILRRVPTSMLVALGLLPIDACKCPLGPCLEPAPVEDPDVGPCLSEPAREIEVNACLTAQPPAEDTDTKAQPKPPADDGALTPCLTPPQPPDRPGDDGSVTPCLSPPDPPDPPGPGSGPKPEPPMHPCLSIAPPVRENGKGGGQGKPPADEPFASADVVQRVLERGDLPPDVLARLRGRA
jgi:hypothetical protein